jgi:hypothetical protein
MMVAIERASRLLGVVCAGAIALLSHHANAQSIPMPAAVIKPDKSDDIILQKWALRLPNEPKVVFQGVVNNDNAGGGAGAMLYPAPTAGVALAALITHGLMNNAIRKREMSRLQLEANKILEPYLGAIGEFRYDDLYERTTSQKRRIGAVRVAIAGEAPGDDWLFVIEPIFSMAQDQRALQLDSSVVVYAPNSPAAPALQTAIRVVSKPVQGETPSQFWAEAAGQQIKNSAAELLAIALEMVSQQISAVSPAEENESLALGQKTVRYQFGGNERIERAEVMRLNCNRAVLKTLRGGLMWVPLKNPHSLSSQLPKSEACKD